MRSQIYYDLSFRARIQISVVFIRHSALIMFLNRYFYLHNHLMFYNVFRYHDFAEIIKVNVSTCI